MSTSQGIELATSLFFPVPPPPREPRSLLGPATVSADTNAARAVLYIRVELDKIYRRLRCAATKKKAANFLRTGDHLSKLPFDPLFLSLPPLASFFPSRVSHPPSSRNTIGSRGSRVVIPQELLDSVWSTGRSSPSHLCLLRSSFSCFIFRYVSKSSIRRFARNGKLRFSLEDQRDCRFGDLWQWIDVSDNETRRRWRY